MQPTLETQQIRAIQNEQLRLVESETGGFSGYGNVKGCLDSHGTIMVDGCYVKCLPDLKKKGFVPDTHGASTNFTPTLKNTLGHFIKVAEDEIGLYVEAKFYNTHAAQEAREQLLSRQADGVESGMSIGFQIESYIYIPPESYEAELPKYLKPEYLERDMEAALNFMGVFILTEINVYEVSLTYIPSNTESLVTEVRSGKGKRRSKTQVTPKGSIHERSKDFDEFTKITKEVFLVIPELSDVDREAIAGELRSFNLKPIEDIITMAKTKTDAAMSEEHKDSLKRVADKLDDAHRAHKRAAEHHQDAMEEHEKCGKLIRSACKNLDDAMDSRDDDSKEDKKDTEEDKKDDKRSTEQILRGIREKLSA